MERNIIVSGGQMAGLDERLMLPRVVQQSGPEASRKFLEFFFDSIRNLNTRAAYVRNVTQFFNWLEERGAGVQQLTDIEPLHVAAYIEQLTKEWSAPTVKQHLAALRMCFDWLTAAGILSRNPAAHTKAPSHVVKVGSTPVLDAEEARQLFDSIDTASVVGLRDRAILGVMTYSFARVSAVTGMRVKDYRQGQKKMMEFHLHEKGGKVHKVPAHHRAVEYMEDYLEVTGLREQNTNAPLFRTAYRRTGLLTENGITRNDVLRMIKRRVKAAGLPPEVCCHTFRATGITVYLKNGGELEKAQEIAAHESPRTTKLYDRRHDEITLDEIERIQI
jgi:integrase/recombinase XerD